MDVLAVSWVTAFWWALAFIVAEALVIAALLRVEDRRENRFGDFADIVRDTHEDNKVIHNENMMVRQDNIRILEQLEECRKALAKHPCQEKSA